MSSVSATVDECVLFVAVSVDIVVETGVADVDVVTSDSTSCGGLAGGVMAGEVEDIVDAGAAVSLALGGGVSSSLIGSISWILPFSLRLRAR